jgi:hypothetical protein
MLVMGFFLMAIPPYNNPPFFIPNQFEISLEKGRLPLINRKNYIINSFDYLINQDQIGKMLEEKIVLRIFHNSLIVFFFVYSSFFYLFYFKCIIC